MALRRVLLIVLIVVLGVLSSRLIFKKDAKQLHAPIGYEENVDGLTGIKTR